MQKIRLLSVTALTLPLLLAACGQSAVPIQTVPAASLVKVRVNSQGLSRTFGAADLHTQGLPSDGHGGLPDMQMKVTVRDGQGAMVAFKDGTYDPSGQGDRTLTLNAQNAFGTTLYLPQGTYSFENATTDAGGTDTLLAYGPSTENVQLVDTDHPNVMLKFHAVLDPAQSKLDFATDTHTVYASNAFNLRLYAKSSLVNGMTYDVPTSDLKMAAPAYTLGSDLEGRINGTGSTLGVNVTALGSVASDDTVLKVTPHVQAWIQMPGTLTASFQDVSLPTFEKQITVAPSIHTDVAAPHDVTFSVQAEVPTNVATDLSGTAFDDVSVQYLRLYADQNLIASTDPADTGVPALTTDDNGHWSASWTAMTLGKHELTLVATDSSGNETKLTQNVNAKVFNFVTLPFSGYNDGNNYYNSAYLTLDPHEDMWIKADLSGCGYCSQYNGTFVEAYSYDYQNLPTYLTLEVSAALGGSVLTPNQQYPYDNGYYSRIYNFYTYHKDLFYHIRNNSNTVKGFYLQYGW